MAGRDRPVKRWQGYFLCRRRNGRSEEQQSFPGTTRSKNSFLWASYFRKLTKDVTAAVEWSYWDFQQVAFPVATNTAIRTNAPVGTTHVFNISFAYQF